MTIFIRDAVLADANIICDFNTRIAKETENTVLDASTLALGVAALLSDPSKGRYWVAEADDGIIGQIMVTYEWSDWRNGVLWWIQSVYIHADYRRRGVFSKLYRHVKSLADAEEVAGIRLYVEKDNQHAQTTYGKLGMAMTQYKVMQVLLNRNKH